MKGHFRGFQRSHRPADEGNSGVESVFVQYPCVIHDIKPIFMMGNPFRNMKNEYELNLRHLRSFHLLRVNIKGHDVLQRTENVFMMGNLSTV